ncbi:MAG: type I DNA topoisomerase [Ignavibacteriales bacterium CG07_land_8_20_14_0_80_59_12]|nr:MAG: type I DNA topoisomerase [Ignavibacteriales bacterium CG07_land_8_20_14_0_80_59_12]
MTKSLLIVESPAKAKTINKYLGRDFIVEASVGHIRNLPKSKLGVDVENGYAPTYEIIKGKKDVLKKIREHAKDAKDVYIATDPDREGEAIARDIAEELKLPANKIKRVLFHEITESGIAEAMKHPSTIDENLVLAQQARRVMDRLVGYKVSPFVWKTVYYGLSAGRVQSVALRLICEREEEIERFVQEEYWTIHGEFRLDNGESLYAKLVRIAGEEPVIKDETTANGYAADIAKHLYRITDVQKKQVKRNPLPPFITSTLQQEAAARLRFSTKKTMMVAQKLYEGVELGGEGSAGLITYMRTDSTRLSSEAVAAARTYIYENYGGEYLPREPRSFRKGKSSQDAHEAIRPTSLKHTPKSVRKFLDKDLFALYGLIWNRFIACQMAPAVFEQVSVEIAGGDYTFRATGSTPIFYGFLQVYAETREPENGEPESPIPSGISPLQAVQLVNVIPEQHFTKPPARYSESTLVKELEALGIGRPSTYALIVSTIQERRYVEQKDRKLYATQLGRDVTRILVQNFPGLFSVKFTAKMEAELDTVASGKRDYVKVLDDFYIPFSKVLERVNKNTETIKKSLQEVTEEACHLCGSPLVVKWGRNGKFIACTAYPECRFTKPLDENEHKEFAGVKCDLCGGDMVVKHGKFGAFLGCSNYPSCKNTKPLTMDMKCPKCGEGNVVVKRTKRGKTFYGCSRYPDCDFASWYKPVVQTCPACGSGYLVQKSSKKKGEYLFCPECREEVLKEEVPV